MLLRLASTTGIRLGGAAAQVFLTLVVARTTSPEDAGAFFFLFGALLILSTVARLGTELSLLRLLSTAIGNEDWDAVCATMSSRAVAVIGGTIAICMGLAAAAPWVEPVVDNMDVAMVLLGVLALPAFVLVGLLSEILKSAHRPMIGVTVQNVGVPIAGMATILIAKTSGPVSAHDAALGLVIGGWATTVVGAGAVRRALTPIRGDRRWFMRPSVEAVKQVLRDSASLLVVSTTSVTMQWTGALLLGFLASAPEVAGYSVAARVSIAVSVVHSAAASVIAPRIAVAADRDDLDEVQRLARRGSLMISGLTWPFLIVLGVAAPTALGLFDSHYSDYAGVLRVLIAGQLVAAVIGHSGNVLVMTGHYGAGRKNSLIALLALAVFMIALVPRWEAVGAAWAMSGAVIVGHVAGTVLLYRHARVWSVPLFWISRRRARFEGAPRG